MKGKSSSKWDSWLLEDIPLSGRTLSEEEAYAIWAALNSAPRRLKNQELRLVLRINGEAQMSGWVIQTETGETGLVVEPRGCDAAPTQRLYPATCLSSR